MAVWWQSFSRTLTIQVIQQLNNSPGEEIENAIRFCVFSFTMHRCIFVMNMHRWGPKKDWLSLSYCFPAPSNRPQYISCLVIPIHRSTQLWVAERKNWHDLKSIDVFERLSQLGVVDTCPIRYPTDRLFSGPIVRKNRIDYCRSASLYGMRIQLK